MERDRQSDHAGIEKEEADDADKSLFIVEIELRLAREERPQQCRIDGEVEHGEVSPLRGEKWSHVLRPGSVSQL